MSSLFIATFILTLLSLLGVILNIKKKRSCFFIWFFTNGSWAIYDYYIGAFWQGVLFTIYFGLAIYGIVEWRKK